MTYVDGIIILTVKHLILGLESHDKAFWACCVPKFANPPEQIWRNLQLQIIQIGLLDYMEKYQLDTCKTDGNLGSHTQKEW